jgi:AbrB family looped-hinge helix DNA binding protein
VTTTLSSKGQIVLPAEIRARHKFRPGDVLAIEERDDEIVLKKTHRKPKKSLAQLLRECPAEIKIERIIDYPRDIKL